MELDFAAGYNAILEKVDRIDPIKYGKTRNYINGAVTYLSPYISRGVISTKQVLESMIDSLSKKTPFFSLRLLQNWSFTEVNSQFISFASLKNEAFLSETEFSCKH